MGTLYIVATPIGNLEDITIRAIKTLFTVDYIACEDTRRTGQLLQNLEFRIAQRAPDSELFIKNLNINKKPRFISYYDEIEFKRIPELIELLMQDKNIALASDGGTPLISDPGFKLVKECIKRGIKIVSIPGPTSLIAALTTSGLATNDFRFIGYLPNTVTKRQQLLKDILNGIRPGNRKYTIIAFVAPHRFKESLEDIKNILGNIDICICRELTKIHEEVWRGEISEALSYFQKPIGEFVVLFSP